jgi:hypothetical protein
VVVCMLIVIDHARYTIPGTGATFGSFFRWNHWGALLLFTVEEDSPCNLCKYPYTATSF